MSEAGDPLTRQLEAWSPQTLIAVGDGAPRLLRGYADRAGRCELVAVPSEGAADRLMSLESERRFDFALVAGYLEQTDADEGGAVIARLRDVLARRLCVWVESATSPGGAARWTDAELAAFGLTLLSRIDQGGASARLFGYDIASYKQTPDWLNPRHWAHPELWGKFRW